MLLAYTQFDDLYLQCFNASEPAGGWPARVQYQDLPRDGAYRLHGTQRAPRDKKTEKRRWTLVAPTGPLLNRTFGQLENKIGVADRLIGVDDAGRGYWTDAELLDVRAVGAQKPVTGRLRGVGIDVETTFMLNTPWWFDEVDFALVFSDLYDTGGGTGDMLLMDIMAPSPGTVIPMTWFVEGEANTNRILITLLSGTGGGLGVTKLYLKNNTTGYTMTWEPTIAVPASLTTGQSLVIDVRQESIQRNAVDAYNQFTLGTHTRWFELAPGINEVDVQILDTATDDSTVLTVAYTPAYP